MKYELVINGLKIEFDDFDSCIKKMNNLIKSYFLRNLEYYTNSGFLRKLDEIYKRKEEDKTIRDIEIILNHRIKSLFERLILDSYEENDFTYETINDNYEYKDMEYEISLKRDMGLIDLEILTKDGFIKTNAFSFDETTRIYFESSIGDKIFLEIITNGDSIGFDDLSELKKYIG